MASTIRGDVLTSTPNVPASSLFEKHQLLQLARDAVTAKNFDQAVHAYSHLIKHRRHLNEIRQDLIQYVRDSSEQAIMWALLGDVLTQEGKHEYADKAYQHAKNLTQ